MGKMVSYAEAAIPQSVTLLKLRLLPFCAGHYLILERYNSPYIKGGLITENDIVFAVLVCSMSYQDFLQFLQQEDCETQIIEWGASVGSIDKSEVNAALLKYMESGVTTPKYWIEGDNESQESGAHWIQSLLLVATGKLGYTRSEAINAPLTQLLYDTLKYAQDNGAIRLMTEDEVELAEGT